MGLITLKVFDNSIEAHILRGRLESENINCFLIDENIISLNPLYNITVGGIKLKIDDSKLSQAKLILDEIDNSKLTDEHNEIIKCPKCDSDNLIYGLKSMRNVKGIFAVIFSFIFFIFPIYYKTVNLCKSCGTEFK